MSHVIEIEGMFYVAATSSLADAAVRVLKHAETFGIFDRHGDIRPLGFENQGLFHQGTRFVSRLKMEIDGQSPLLLSSSVKEDNDLLVVDLTNPPLPLDGGGRLHNGILHFVRHIFLWETECFERVEISNFAQHAVGFDLVIRYAADFADLFEVRGMERSARGRILEPAVERDGVTMGYEGLDGVWRGTSLQFSKAPAAIDGNHATFRIHLEPRENTRLDLRIRCQAGGAGERAEPYDRALQNIRRDCSRFREDFASIETSDAQFNQWITQSQSDLHMLVSCTPHGPYPFAGIPWYSCVFGRDGIITALETLWCQPHLARGVLAYLASHQATENIPEKDAEPGKIVHEERKGEMAATGEIPFGNYYGTIDATPLFVVLAGRYHERTADTDFIRSLWPNILRALAWIDESGDCDGDGFVEYQRHSGRGLGNQGWKDSDDSVFHSDGSLAEPPIALCEVQAYVFEAKMLAARMEEALGDPSLAGELRAAAERLRERFESAFWCGDIGTYALALDAAKRPCRVRSSNAGHCLFSGIVTEPRAAEVAAVLAGEAFCSGWGIRTIPTGEARYNPMSYHNGSIWPHDNALVASGLARYGHKRAVARVFDDLFAASQHMDLRRMPELFCGFDRRQGEGPTLYPVACNPQAWAAATVFSLFESCLGMRIDGAGACVRFRSPCLPDSLRRVTVRNLELPHGALDFTAERHDGGVAIAVLRREGAVRVVVEQ